MIPANELRLGNWYLHQTNGNYYKLGTSDFMDYLNEAQVNKGEVQINPIPLTPAILMKCEFHRDKEGWYLSADNKLYDPLVPNGIGEYSQGDTTMFAFKHGDRILKRGLKHLHQLQNLYFALTGKELDLNP